MLPTDDSRFQPLNPYEAVRKMQEESPSIPWFEPEKEHKIDKYMNLMLGLLKQALAAGSHRPLRVAGLKLEVQDGSLEERWTEVSSDLQNRSGLTDMEEIERRFCLQPFQRIFCSMRTTFDGLQELTAEAVPELLRTGGQLQKSEQELRSKLKIISNTLKTAENYVSQDDPQWDQAIDTLKALPTQIQEAQEIMERYKEEGRRAPSQVSTLQSVCLKIGEDLNYLRSVACTHLTFSIPLLEFHLRYGLLSDERLLPAAVASCVIVCAAKAIVIGVTAIPTIAIAPLHIVSAIAALHIIRHFGPTEELRIASDIIRARFGMQGFKSFINILTAFYGRMERYAGFLKDELDQFMARLKTLEEVLQQNEEKSESLQQQLNTLASEALLLVSQGSAIQGNSDPARVEEKKLEWKAKCEQMLNSLEQMQAACPTEVKLEMEITGILGRCLSSPWQVLQELPVAQVEDSPDGLTV